ncbi:Gfo/Idh/MocA family protein [Candidatus Pantoea carbekii]|uniref:Gfo/Idh/MocA family protein n=1 Tax=Candidatus Pantoea carbekii TaxID=1235990 RepID=UPI0006187870|nr:Gfo/Idh/MocA family oxidoreductase [Candidatus Pantoea carbekii]AKC32614.1 putative dehydrogenase [Candidatus Pantoea carbekii]
MKISIIGCGNIIIKEHIPAIISLGIKVCALCDLSIENINKAKNLLHYDVPSFLYYKELVYIIKPNIVLIALPHNIYCEVLSFCSQFPMRIIKEKPFALTLLESKIFSDFSRSRSFKIFTVCQKRYTLAYEILKHEVQRINEKISYLKIRYTIPSNNPNKDWRRQYATSGGGVWFDMGYHIVDIINYLFDGKEIKVNYARLINSSCHYYNVDDIAFVEFECDGAIILAYISCVAIEKYEDVTMYGQNTIFHANKNHITLKNKKQEILKYIKVENTSPFVKMYQEFLCNGGEAAFERNLSRSISLMRVLEEASKKSNFCKK